MQEIGQRRRNSSDVAHSRRTALLAVPLLALAAIAPAASGAPAEAPRPSPYDGGGAVLNVLPAGARGLYSATDIAAFRATGARPPNTVDQLTKYDDLTKGSPADLQDADLSTRYYKDARLGVADSDVVSTTTPRAGTVIKRDKNGVPHVFGDSYDDTLYGAGYAGTQDRMFLQDTLRHVGGATTAAFLGPSPANIAMDVAQLQVAAYTPEEAAAQITNLPKRFGAEGTKVVNAFAAFVQGINDAQRAACPTLVAATCPGEYAALQLMPQDFTAADIVDIASLVGGIFGKGGGEEDRNARWLQQLQRQFGGTEGRRVYDDLRESTDAEAPTTSPNRVDYGIPQHVVPGANVLPDLDAPVSMRTGTRTDPFTNLPTGPPGAPGLPGVPGLPAAPAAVPDHVDGPLGAIQLTTGHRDMSNALLVDAKHSATGHPLAVFGPQVGYFAPQILTEIDLEGPGVSAWGSSFAGTQGVVELGHGRDYAWSATSSDDDNVDVVAEKLCNIDGSAPTTASTSYLVDGRCTPMDAFTHTELAKPSAGGVGLPQQLQFTVQRTRHGIVQSTTTAGGAPIALVLQRSTYGGEFDSVVGFSRINDPDFVHDAASFKRAFEGVDYTFNWFYADDKDIAYYNSALLPAHADGYDPSLPRDGSQSRYDWQGFAPDSAHPQVVNPPSGSLVSWNNKQAPGFAAADNVWGYGAVYRSLALSDRVTAGISGGRTMTRVGLVAAMADAATVDVRATYVLPLALDVIGDDPANAPAVALLRSWIARGAHRIDRDRSGTYEDAAAIALFDTWWESQTTSSKGAISLPKDAMRGALGPLVDQLPRKVDDHPRLGLGSSWNDVAWYGYLSKDLRQVLGRGVASPYSRGYCGGGSLDACRADLRASLAAAVAETARAQGTSDPGAWTYPKVQDDIVARTIGVVGVPNIDWQNRPTFQQVVSFTTHRDRAGVPTSVQPAVQPAVQPKAKPRAKPKARPKAVRRTTHRAVAHPSQPRRTLAFTGLAAGLPVVALLLLGTGLLARRRRT